TIFMKFFSRSSRATGPKMRVPRGFCAWSMITAAFSSNAICVPSSRICGLRVRTTTALTTSPFLIAPCGVAVLTVPTMMSPTRAYRRWWPPTTRMQRISRAPVLSAILRRDSCWIIESPRSPGGLHDLGQAPALRLGQRTRLDDADDVADLRLVLLVVRMELDAAPDDLLVALVRADQLDLDDDRLVHRARDDDATALLAPATVVLGLRLADDRLALSARGGATARFLRAQAARQPLPLLLRLGL